MICRSTFGKQALLPRFSSKKGSWLCSFRPFVGPRLRGQTQRSAFDSRSPKSIQSLPMPAFAASFCINKQIADFQALFSIESLQTPATLFQCSCSFCIEAMFKPSMGDLILHRTPQSKKTMDETDLCK